MVYDSRVICSNNQHRMSIPASELLATCLLSTIHKKNSSKHAFNSEYIC